MDDGELDWRFVAGMVAVVALMCLLRACGVLL